MTTDDDLTSNSEALAALYEAAARKTAEPLAFDETDITEN